MQTEIHPTNLAMIDGAIFEGRYEGILRRRTAAEWLALFAHNRRAQVAIRAARDGQEASFAESPGIVWNLRPAA